VIFAGDLFYGGNTVIVDHRMGIFTTYSHLNKIIAERGQSVTGPWWVIRPKS
jgi:murein DD-endopeptidase MepM/ murein hydrolase activator NlpD